MTLTRRPMCLFAMLAFASTLFAADPFVGTWKLDPSKSKHSGDVPNQKEATIVIEEQGDNYQVTVTGTNSDNSALSVKYTVPMKGGTGQVEAGGDTFDAITSKRIGSNQRESTYMKGRKNAGTRRSVVSKDGKMLTNTFKGTDAQGNPVTSTQVFDKQ
jgi:hypothetical protein